MSAVLPSHTDGLNGQEEKGDIVGRLGNMHLVLNANENGQNSSGHTRRVYGRRLRVS
jgi:hypothetical protein